MRLLLAEDDRDLCDITALQLREAGYEVDIGYDGEEALYYINTYVHDLIILDRMMPWKDGLTILSDIRKKGIMTPVIMVTALNGIHDKIDGLDAGADDYVVKPFEMEELLARIRALLRRPRTIEALDTLSFEDLVLNIEQNTLSCRQELRTLSKRELSVMEFFMRNAGQILSREQILTRVWGMDSYVEEGNIDNYIYFLRRRLKALPTCTIIKTIHGIGYRLERKEDV